MSNAIACQNLSTSYVKFLDRPILQGINCAIAPGEFVALVGLNGAGKSTLLRTMVGLVPICQGQILINGMELNPKSQPELLAQIGFLCQGGGLVRQLSALENVLCGSLRQVPTWRSLFGFPASYRRRAMDLLDRMGLANQANQVVDRLSGGQQQKVAIARALMLSPKILLADEPVTGLDTYAVQQVMETFAELQRDRGITVVVVLHDLKMAASYAQRAIMLAEGRVMYDGRCENVEAVFSELQPA
jgi:phosphonate transport system ATP-binding protein